MVIYQQHCVYSDLDLEMTWENQIRGRGGSQIEETSNSVFNLVATGNSGLKIG